jgi:hypothetical protein
LQTLQDNSSILTAGCDGSLTQVDPERGVKTGVGKVRRVALRVLASILPSVVLSMMRPYKLCGGFLCAVLSPQVDQMDT